MKIRITKSRNPEVVLGELATTHTSIVHELARRDALLRHGYELGLSLRTLGEIAGLNHETVRKIVTSG